MDDDALDGFEFLTMAEAVRVGHTGRSWASSTSRRVFRESKSWSNGPLPIQRRHLKSVLDGSLDLAGQENPDEVEG